MSVAVGARIDFSIDLNDVAQGDGYLFVRDGVGFAGRGVALETTASTATKALGTIEADAEAHPIAFGAIPFIGDSQARFVVPAITVEKTDSGAALVTSIAEDRTTALRQLRSTIEAMRGAVRPRSASASSYSVAPLVAVDTYLAAVDQKTAQRDAAKAALANAEVQFKRAAELLRA